MDLSPAMSIVEAESATIAPCFSKLERLAITIGIMDGQIARRRSGILNFFAFHASPKPISLADPRLEALRAYAELARALFPRDVPTTILEQAGFSASQTRELLEVISTQAEARTL